MSRLLRTHLLGQDTSAFSSTGEFPTWQTLHGVPPAPLAVRRGGGVRRARSSTLMYAQSMPSVLLVCMPRVRPKCQVQHLYVCLEGQPMCQTRLCFDSSMGDPTCVFFHGTVCEPVSFPWQSPRFQAGSSPETFHISLMACPC